MVESSDSTTELHNLWGSQPCGPFTETSRGRSRVCEGRSSAVTPPVPCDDFRSVVPVYVLDFPRQPLIPVPGSLDVVIMAWVTWSSSHSTSTTRPCRTAGWSIKTTNLKRTSSLKRRRFNIYETVSRNRKRDVPVPTLTPPGHSFPGGPGGRTRAGSGVVGSGGRVEVRTVPMGSGGGPGLGRTPGLPSWVTSPCLWSLTVPFQGSCSPLVLFGKTASSRRSS